MAALFILLLCVKFCNLVGGDTSNKRQSPVDSRILLVTSTPVRSGEGRTLVSTLSPSLKVSFLQQNAHSKEHIATKTHGAASVNKPKTNGSRSTSGSGIGIIRIISKTSDFHLKTNYATKLSYSGRDSVHKRKETSNTVKLNPTLFRSSVNSDQGTKSREPSIKAQKVSSSNRVLETSAVPAHISSRVAEQSSSPGHDGKASEMYSSRLPSDIRIKPSSSSSLLNLSPSPEVHISRTSRTATLVLQPTPTHFYPSHEKFKSSVLSTSPTSIHKGITSSSKVAYDETTTPQSVLKFPLTSTSTGSDIVTKLPTTKPLTNRIFHTLAPPPAVKPLSCGGGDREACVCYNCHAIRKPGEKCCMDLIDKELIKQGIIMRVADLTVAKFIALERSTIQEISNIIAQECRTPQSCVQEGGKNTISRLKRNVNVASDRVQQSPHIQIAKQFERHKTLARTFDWDNKIKIVARPSSNSITSLLGSTPDPSLELKVTMKRDTTFVGKAPVVKAVVFHITTVSVDTRSLEAALYSTVTSFKDGANRTQAIDSGKLSRILNDNKAVLESKLNITIASFKEWKEIHKRGTDGSSAPLSPSPTDVLSSTTSAVGSNTVAKVGSDDQRMSRKSFVIAVSAGVVGFLVILLLFIFLMTRCSRKWKGEFVPDRAYQDCNQQNDSSSMISSFVDPSVPRITDVPHKPKVPPGQMNGTNNNGNIQNGKVGSKKTKKPAGVKVTYKPPKWD